MKVQRKRGRESSKLPLNNRAFSPLSDDQISDWTAVSDPAQTRLGELGHTFLPVCVWPAFKAAWK